MKKSKYFVPTCAILLKCAVEDGANSGSGLIGKMICEWVLGLRRSPSPSGSYQSSVLKWDESGWWWCCETSWSRGVTNGSMFTSHLLFPSCLTSLCFDWMRTSVNTQEELNLQITCVSLDMGATGGDDRAKSLSKCCSYSTRGFQRYICLTLPQWYRNTNVYIKPFRWKCIKLFLH